MESLKEIPKTVLHSIYFSWYDYLTFGSMLALSTAIGVYFGCYAKKQNTATEYFMGGKKMTVFPIAMSLVASHVSSVTLMAVPADVYRFGSMYLLSTISIFTACIATRFIFLPVFYELQLNSTNEYLKLRFTGSVRTFVSLIFVITGLLYMAVVVYTPALAFSQATGFSVYQIIPVICAVCIFYTTIGGLKAVVWTDTIQFSITVGVVVLVIILGFFQIGGLGNAVSINKEGQRLDFSWEFDPTKRETILAVFLNFALYYTRMTGTSQECVLKFLALPTFKEAKRALYLFCLGLIFVKIATVVTGWLIYAKYAGCDPLSSGIIQKNDQLLPYYVADIGSHITGLSGLFISGVFCTALSTLSAALNAFAATVYQDFLIKYLSKETSQDCTSLLIKLIVVILGVIVTVLALLVKHLGGILELAISIAGLSGGTLLGLFILGTLCPKANSKGAFWGTLTSMLVMGWLFLGAQWYKAKGLLTYPPKPLTTDRCDFEVPQSFPNSTTSSNINTEELFILYRISYYYYYFIGIFVCVFVGIIVSYAFKSDERPVNKKYLSPLVHFMVEDNENEKYFSINKAIEMVTVNDARSIGK